MKYFGKNSDITNATSKTGVLIANLGTPEKPICPKLRKYLAQFLTDPRVIELPTLLRQFLVRGIIVNIRSHKSAAAYREVWTKEGSPLMVHSQNLTNKVQTELGDNYIVALGMRYGEPSVDIAFKQLHNAGCRKVVIIPMYPQYSGSTTGSIMDALGATLRKQRWVPELHFINAYYENVIYIKALTDSVSKHWEKHGKADKLIFSFHGIPQRYIKNGDPYQAQCEATVSAVVERLGLQPDQWLLVYQSRVGKEPWLQPYCDKTMASLPQNGVSSVDVICPGFSADCLETIEEIDQENREYFLGSGGKQYRYIPCLNSSDSHVELVASIVRGYSC